MSEVWRSVRRVWQVACPDGHAVRAAPLSVLQPGRAAHASADVTTARDRARFVESPNM